MLGRMRQSGHPACRLVSGVRGGMVGARVREAAQGASLGAFTIADARQGHRARQGAAPAAPPVTPYQPDPPQGREAMGQCIRPSVVFRLAIPRRWR